MGTLIAVVLVLLMMPRVALAQPNPVHLTVDYPAVDRYGGRPTAAAYGSVYIAGWTFNCYTGQQPPEIRAYYTDNAHRLVEVRDAVVYWRLVRPDVQAYAPYACNSQYVPQVHLPNNPYLGFAIWFPTPIPRGLRVIVVRVSDPIFQPTTDETLGTKYWQGWFTIQ